MTERDWFRRWLWPLIFAVWWAMAVAMVTPSPLGAQERIETGPSRPVKVQLEGVPTGALVTMLMRDVMKVPYVIGPDVLADKKPVSVNLVMPRRELPVRVVRFLRGIGLTVNLEGGTVYVTKGPANAYRPAALADPQGPAALPIGSPLAPQAAPIAAPSQALAVTRSENRSENLNEPEPESVFAIIRPAHRSPGEVAEFLTALLPGLTISARNDTGAENVTRPQRFEGDALAIGGERQDVERAIAIARSIDKPRPQVEIRAVLFEVRTTESRASALSLLAEVAGASVQVETGPIVGNNIVRFATGGLRAVLSATRADGRFKVVAEPSLAALSGSSATINAGSQVPTIGAVTFAEDGSPVRSVVYRDSGVSLTVAPIVRGGEIELAVQQERSSFAKTTTGVDDSPTLNRASASALLAMAPGETIALAGLKENSEGDGRQRFLGGLFGGRSREKSESELLLLIQADIAPARDVAPLSVEYIGEGEKVDA